MRIAFQLPPEVTEPLYTEPDTSYLPDEDHMNRLVVGIAIGMPVSVGLGIVLMTFTLYGHAPLSHALVLSLPFGGFFGLLMGGLAGLMATTRH